jgi:hypothetical protein
MQQLIQSKISSKDVNLGLDLLIIEGKNLGEAGMEFLCKQTI